jgi:hypothetical protein
LTERGKPSAYQLSRSEWFPARPRKVPDNQADQWQEKHNQKPD